MRSIHSTETRITIRNLLRPTRAAALPVHVQQVGYACWNVQGMNFVLMHYRPPGAQMALRNQSLFAQKREIIL